MVLSQPAPGLWRIQIHGPVPLRYENVYSGENEARASAFDIACYHLARHAPLLSLPSQLIWIDCHPDSAVVRFTNSARDV